MSRLQAGYSHQDLPAPPLRWRCCFQRQGGFRNKLLAKSLGEHLSGQPCDDVIDAAGSIADQQKTGRDG